MRVKLVSNLTDVNDKIYDAARAEGVPSADLARRYSEAYVADTDRLGLGRPDVEPTVTETIPEIVELIGTLVEMGLAYPSRGDVYYRVGRFPGYGRLSGRRLDEMEPQEPGPGKESPLDFALWKGRKPDEDTWWESPWGPGRPGWHIECSAMAEATLGHGFEVHGGGIDLIFPHHENEIAQSEGAHGGRMASIWMHNEMLELGDEKMSKSVGNIAPLSEVLDRWPAEVVIAFFLTSHYRSRLPFTEERMGEAAAVVERLGNALASLDRAIGRPRRGDRPRAHPGRGRDPHRLLRRARRRLRHAGGLRGPLRPRAGGEPRDRRQRRGCGPAARCAPRAARAARRPWARVDRARPRPRGARRGHGAAEPPRGRPRGAGLRRRRRGARPRPRPRLRDHRHAGGTRRSAPHEPSAPCTERGRRPRGRLRPQPRARAHRRRPPARARGAGPAPARRRALVGRAAGARVQPRRAQPLGAAPPTTRGSRRSPTPTPTPNRRTCSTGPARSSASTGPTTRATSARSPGSRSAPRPPAWRSPGAAAPG